MAEREQEHRIDLETKGLQAAIDDTRRGQYLGAGISLLAVAGAIISIYLAAPWYASVAFLGVPLMGLAKAIVDRGFDRRSS